MRPDSVRTRERENSAAWIVIIAMLVGLALTACTGMQPVQTRVVAVAESNTPPVASVSPLAVPTGNVNTITPPAPTLPAQWAFLHDHTLYIHHNGHEIQIEDCHDEGCQIYHMRWSPHGSYLFYYVGPAELSVDRVKADDELPRIVLRVADLHGRVRTLTDKATVLPPPPWSSYLETVVHFQPGGFYGEDEPLFEEVVHEDLEAWQDRFPEIVDTDQFQYAPPPLELLDDFGPDVECGVHRQSHVATDNVEE